RIAKAVWFRIANLGIAEGPECGIGVQTMRKSLWLVALTIALAGPLVYWRHTVNRTDTNVVVPENDNHVARDVKGDGDAELSEAIEPLRVDGGATVAVPPVDDDPLPPVVLEPGMRQP